MIYLIDNNVLFDSGRGSLSRISSQEKINILPRPAVLLLDVLVNSPGETITRDSLMEAAWKDAGLTLSGHNLSTYLKVLRHSLLELEIEKEFIRTLPRVGVLLVVDVEIISNDAYLGQGNKNSIHAPANNINKNPFTMSYCLFLVALIVLFLAFQLLWPVTQDLNFRKPAEKMKLLTTEGKCQIYTKENPSSFLINTIPFFLKDVRISNICQVETKYVFYSALKYEYNIKITAVVCALKNGTNIPEECTTYIKEINNVSQ